MGTYTTPNFDHSRVAGDRIHLGITVVSEFDHSTLEFAPHSCIFEDTGNDLKYTLLKTVMQGGCSNEDVGLTVDYATSGHIWQLSHILFLFRHHDESRHSLTCMMHVCTISAYSVCDDI